MIILDTEVDGRLVDVEIRDGVVAAVAAQLPRTGPPIFHAHGGALLPGLHDHHVHLNAMAAQLRSVKLDPATTSSSDELARQLRQGTLSRGWIRATQYHEDMAGELDRWRLDALMGADLAQVPVRVQHRSGAMWMLNSAAVERLLRGRSHDVNGIERDSTGEPTGRVWRADHVVRVPGAAGDEHGDDLRTISRWLLSRGVTGVTDATPDLCGEDLAVLRAVSPLRLVVMGADTVGAPAGTALGPRKIVVADHDLPDVDSLASRVRHARGSTRRPVALHCVSLESLVVVLAALRDAGTVPGDRLEHGAVVPAVLVGDLHELGLTVVTQPDFLRVRGQQYRRHVHPGQLDDLYRYRTLQTSGVRVVPSSDAPYASADPWQVIRSASTRHDQDGSPVGEHETVDAVTALEGYLRDPLRLEQTRRIQVGAVADLCLLNAPLEAALHAIQSRGAPTPARATWVGGELVHVS